MLVRDRAFVIRRAGDHTGSSLEFTEAGKESVFGSEAEAALQEALVAGDGLTLDMALTTSGLMQQDDMRHVLEAKPSERFRHISTVLGLGALEDFEDAVRQAASDAKTAADDARAQRDADTGALISAQDRLATARAQLEIRPRLDLFRTEVLELVQRSPSGLVVRLSGQLASPDEFRALALEAGRMVERLQAYVRHRDVLQEIEAGLLERPSDETMRKAMQLVEETQSAASSTENEVTLARSRLDAANSASEELARLASLAIPLLTENCPVCGQIIDPAQVERELRARSSGMSVVLTLQKQVQDAELLHSASVEASERASASLRTLQGRRRAWETYQRQVAEFAEETAALATSAGIFATASTDTQELGELAPVAVEYVGDFQRRVLRIVDTLGQDLDSGHVDRAQRAVEVFSEALNARNQRLEELSQRARILKEPRRRLSGSASRGHRAPRQGSPAARCRYFQPPRPTPCV